MKVCWKDLQIPENKIMNLEEIKVEIAKQFWTERRWQHSHQNVWGVLLAAPKCNLKTLRLEQNKSSKVSDDSVYLKALEKD